MILFFYINKFSKNFKVFLKIFWHFIIYILKNGPFFIGQLLVTWIHFKYVYKFKNSKKFNLFLVIQHFINHVLKNPHFFVLIGFSYFLHIKKNLFHFVCFLSWCSFNFFPKNVLFLFLHFYFFIFLFFSHGRSGHYYF
jgi:hypothetical protein